MVGSNGERGDFMYYEEKMIDGVLHWRNTPDGDWTPFTAESLSTSYVAMKRMYDELHSKTVKLMDKLDRVKGII